MFNDVTLIGRLTKNPELKITTGGTSVCIFTLAVKRNYKNESNEYDTDFIQCVAWNKVAEHLCNFTKKGAMIGIKGRLETHSYTRDEEKVYITNVHVKDLSFILKPKQSAEQNNKEVQE